MSWYIWTVKKTTTMNPERITLDNPARAAIIAQIEQRGTTKPSKYRNEQVRVDNIIFASKREARRYQQLRLEEQAGAIAQLRLQVRYRLTVNGQPVCYYVADFVYQRDGQETVEDAKGVKTDVYRIKKKLMKAIYSINIIET